MDAALLMFLALVAFGGYVQTVAGFAMGMILIAGTSALGLYSLPVVTAVISLVSLLNILLSLHGHYHRVYRRGLLLLVLGQVPAIAAGVWLLDWLDATAQHALRALLGVFIVLGCGAMMIRPQPRASISAPSAFLVAGLGGGLLGGLFSAAGPVMGWFVYRQPLMVVEIRATLLAAFSISTLTRTLVVGLGGGLTDEVWSLTLAAVPLVLLTVWVGRRFPPPVSETSLRRLAFALLFLMGFWTLGTAAAALSGG